MKQIKILLGLILLASVSTFAQSPRIKLNQITKDSLTGSVLISSPSDSGMVYSRDLFISYGADTVMILYGDTLAATSGIISSVLSDGVTITGDGTSGNELKVDTATVISTIQGLVDSLANYVTLSGTETITGAKTFTNTFTQSGGDANFDSGTLFVDESANNVGIGTTSPSLFAGLTLYGTNKALEIADGTYTSFVATASAANEYGNGSQAGQLYLRGQSGIGFTGNSGGSTHMTINSSGKLGIGETSPSEKLDVNGKVKIQDLTGTGGNAVYENGGVLGVASDARFKTYVGDIQNGITLINQLKPKYFIDNRNSSFQQLGFYAQEVKSVINEASYPIGNTDYLGINDRAILATTVKAIQEQQEQIETLQIELDAKSLIIETQQIEINQLKNLITDLTNRIQILENK